MRCRILFTDSGVITVQKHFGGDRSFDRTWSEFKVGFGAVTDINYWIGNDRLHELTKYGQYKLRVELQTSDSRWIWAEYSTFRVDSEGNGYRLMVGGYSGTAGDAFIHSDHNLNGAMFSTKDHDNDSLNNGNCAQLTQGGFWFKHCGYVRINGVSGVNLGFVWLQTRLSEARALLIRVH